MRSRLPWRGLLLIGAAAGALWGQDSILRQFNPLSPTRSGIQLYSVSAFSSYYTAGVPFGVNVSFGAPLAADLYSGAGVTVGWSKLSPKRNASVIYSPSYVRNALNAPLSAINHSLSLNFATNLSRKWSASTSAGGLISNMEQLLFAPTVYGNVASLPATFDELSAAVLTGSSTNAQLASLVTGAPLATSPDQTFAYGNRVLSASLQATLSYAHSARSSIQFGVTGTRAQHLRLLKDAPSDSGSYLIPQTATGAVHIGWGYSLSPRTHIGASVGTTRMFSRSQQAYTTRATFSIGRTMSRRWFVHGQAGAGSMAHVRQTSAGPRGLQYIAGGGLGFKTAAHTFLASYNRTIGDPYGIGSDSTGSAAGAWSWWRPGRSWSVHATASQQTLRGKRRLQSWTAAGGVSRSLGARLFVSIEYAYMQLPAYASMTREYLSQQGARVSLNWMPFAR